MVFVALKMQAHCLSIFTKILTKLSMFFYICRVTSEKWLCHCANYTLHKYPLLSTARSSFIQLIKLEQCRVKKLAHDLIQEHRIGTRVLLVESVKL